MRVILLRHGESEANVKRQFAGFTDTPLTERGRAQAEQVALYLGWYQFSRIISSPLERAYETAWLASQLDMKGSDSGRASGIEKWDGFKEMNFGRCEGLTLEGISAQEPQLTESFALDYSNAVYPEGESLVLFYERVVATYKIFIEECLKSAQSKDSEEDILLVTHSGVIRAILAHEIGGRFESYWHYKIENCGYAVLEYSGDFAVLSELNNAICKE